ncbi:MAG: ral secretion pathway protein [Acidobacteriota bacterium]|nr:ral secretion pathway protein [Acidobacteriota bacterium]
MSKQIDLGSPLPPAGQDLFEKRSRHPQKLLIFFSLAGLIVLILATLTACMSRPEPVNIIKEKPTAEKKAKSDKKTEKTKKDKFVWVQQPIESESVVSSAATRKGEYLMNFDDIAVPDFIETMMTGVFKQNYLITDAAKAVSRRITVKMTEDLKADRAFALFIQILRMMDVTVEKKENIYVFDAAQKGLIATMRGALIYGRRIPENLAVTGGEEVTMLVPFYNIDPGTLKAVLEKMMPPQAVIVPVPELNLLVINGTYEDIKYTLSFIDLLDRSQFKEKSIVMITPEYWGIDEFETKVMELLRAEGINPTITEKSGGILFIPIQKLNSLIVISPVKDWIQRVLYWLEKLDIPEAAGEAKKVFSYKLKNVQVDSVYEILQSYSQGTSPDLSRLSRLSSSTNRGSGVKSDNKSDKTASPSPSGQNVTVRDLPGATGNRAPGVNADDLTQNSVIIIPVIETNSVVIIATPVEYKKYQDIIERIDVPRQQVFVEVIIGEVSLDRTTQLGIEFWINRYLRNSQFGTKGGLGVYKGKDTSGNILTPLGGNFFASGVLENGQYEVLMNALVDNSQINIISTPKLTVVENEQAEISVGSDVPVITSETAVSSGQVGALYPIQSVQYINTGIILKVKAAILTDNKISLDISQEVSEALENKTSDISSPEILKRTIKTILIVTEGEIAFIGGLFQKKLSTGGSGIPVLSKIPLLGNLFKNEKKQVKKTELVVFINSKTIRKSSDMKEIVEAVKKLYSVSEDVISTSENKK